MVGEARCRQAVLSDQIDIPDEVRGTLRQLVHDTLLPEVATLHPRPEWTADAIHMRAVKPSHDSFIHGVKALLTTHDPSVILAFIGKRPKPDWGHARSVIALPVIPHAPERWLRWFLTELREHNPEMFPDTAQWQEQPQWAPPRLRSAIAARAQLVEARARLLAELEAKQAQTEATVRAETDQAQATVWRLLQAQGNELEKAVAEALGALGFVVQVRDEQVTPGQPKLEDLRLSDPDAPHWTALVEIKGFEKGASPKGVVQLMTRARTAYIKQTQQEPGAVYYVVNHELALPPDDRPEALRGDSAIDMLAESDGALIDTRDLLHAHLAVLENPELGPQLRASIRSSRGTWTSTHMPTDAPTSAATTTEQP